jgi:hypothetical protein
MALGLALLVPVLAQGQSAEPRRNILSVAEPRVQLSLDPGGAAEGELRFTYDGPTSTSGRVSVVEYRLTSNGPQFTPLSSQPQDHVVRWVTVSPATLELRPGVPEAVRYRVETPTSARPGDHSAMVLVESDQPGARVGVRLTVNVPGAAEAKSELVGFQAQRVPLMLLSYQIPTDLPFYDSGPVVFRAQVRNSGELQLSPGGSVVVTDLLGNRVANLDLPADQVFPGDTATYAVPWLSPPALGWFKATLALQAGDASLTAEEQLVVLPWQQVLAALLFVVALRLLLGSGFSFPVLGRRQVATAGAEGSAGELPRAHAAQAAAQPVLSAEQAPLASATLEEQPAPRRVGPDHAQTNETVEPVVSAAPAVEATTASTPAPELAGQLNGKAEQRDVLELLQRGQQAARSGERLAAYRMFVQVVEIDPRNEEAWLWRAATTVDPRECRQCLEWVLQLNPSNQRARRGLESLEPQVARAGV